VNLIWHSTYTAFKSGKKELFDYVSSLAPIDYQWKWDELNEGALESIVQKLFNKHLLGYVVSLVLLKY
jgi:hypothetical protein